MKKSRRGLPGWIIPLVLTGVIAGLALWRGLIWPGALAALLGGVVTFCTYSVGKAKKIEREKKETPIENKPGSAVDSIAADGRQAVADMMRLRASIRNPGVRERIDRLIDISGKIVKDAKEDPSDAPQIRRFLDYYLPTTIKLLRAYERMESAGGEGENAAKSMSSIESMLDTALEAYQRHYDSLFENQAMDIETDIAVMNSLFVREGLSGAGYDDIMLDAARGGTSAAAVQEKEE